MRSRALAVTALAVASAGLAVAGCSSSSTSSGSSPASSSAGSGGDAYGGAYGGAPSPSAASSTPSGAGAQVALRTTALGTFLVDGKGRTLYLFEQDTSTTSTCTGTCAVAWPPFLTNGMPQPGTGVKAGLLGTTKRSDGTTEVTYNGHPLYFFQSDTAPGQTNGQGLNAFGAAWYVVNASGNKIDKS